MVGDTNIEDSTGVVGANYGQVFQSFLNPGPELASFVRADEFSTTITDRTRSFTGRDFVFDVVEAFVRSTDPGSGYLLITGEPGIGKTAIASSLVMRYGCVHHFNMAPSGIRSPAQFLGNVCAQLILRYDLPYKSLPARASEDSGFLLQLLREAAESNRRLGRPPVVVVIDALDEAERSMPGAAGNRLLLPKTLPDGVFFVVTARKEAYTQLDVDHPQELHIDDTGEANMGDVRLYLRAFASEHADTLSPRLEEAGQAIEDFVRIVAERSEGNFMYLVHVLPEIERGQLNLQESGSAPGLPLGLKGYYQRHWDEMKSLDDVDFTERQRPVLCFLATVDEPPTLGKLCEWSGLAPDKVRRVLTEWTEFLNPDDGRHTYRIYHRSFAEFLDEQEDLEYYRNQIIDHVFAKIPGLST